MKSNAELRELSISELQQEILEYRKKQFQLRMQKVNGTLSKTHQVESLRRAIARAKTIMTEKVGKSNDN